MKRKKLAGLLMIAAVALLCAVIAYADGNAIPFLPLSALEGNGTSAKYGHTGAFGINLNLVGNMSTGNYTYQINDGAAGGTVEMQNAANQNVTISGYDFTGGSRSANLTLTGQGGDVHTGVITVEAGDVQLTTVSQTSPENPQVTQIQITATNSYGGPVTSGTVSLIRPEGGDDPAGIQSQPLTKDNQGSVEFNVPNNQGSNPASNLVVAAYQDDQELYNAVSPSPVPYVSPSSASYTKGAAGDAPSFTMEPEGVFTLTVLKAGETALQPGTDYTAAGGVYTISKDFLDKQPAGVLTLTFVTDSGDSVSVPVTIIETSAQTTSVQTTSGQTTSAQTTSGQTESAKTGDAAAPVIWLALAAAAAAFAAYLFGKGKLEREKGKRESDGR